MPNNSIQRDMADEVVAAVMTKAGKGVAGGSYRSLVEDYGPGALIRRTAAVVCGMAGGADGSGKAGGGVCAAGATGSSGDRSKRAAEALVPLRFRVRDLEPDVEFDGFVGPRRPIAPSIPTLAMLGGRRP